MRSISGVEILLFARLLLVVSPDHHRSFADRLLDEVEEGGRHLRVFGRCHPQFGDGSLMARCLSLSPPKEPVAGDPVFLVALISVCRALIDHSKV
jgi:hypothetical protein